MKLENLEEAEFEIEKRAFKPKVLHCSECNLKMERKKRGKLLN